MEKPVLANCAKLYQSPRKTICLAVAPQVYLWLRDDLGVDVSSKGPNLADGWKEIIDDKLALDMLAVHAGEQKTING